MFGLLFNFSEDADDAIVETEKIQLSDGLSSRRVTQKELIEALNKAKLDEIGFVEYKRETRVTGADGKERLEHILGYRKSVKCSEEKKARKQLEERLPKDLFSTALNRRADGEAKEDSPRLHQRDCDVGIEIKLPDNGRKRFFFFSFRLVIIIG